MAVEQSDYRMPRALVMMLAGLAALAPLGTDIYLSAVPVMAEAFHAAYHDIEVTVSFFLIGMSCGQLLGGPLSDRYGRRKMVMTGLSLFLLASAAMLMNENLYLLWGLRIIQALGAGLAGVSAMSVVRDMSSGRAGATNMMRVVQVMLIAPLIAPLIGMVILQLAGWRAIFVFLVLYCLVLLVLFYLRVPESSPKQATGNLLGNYWHVIRDRRVWSFLGAMCGAYAGMFAFITASPTVYMDFFGLTSTQFPFAFGANVVAMVLMGKLNIRLLKKHSPSWLIQLGQYMQLACSFVMLTYLLLVEQPNFWIALVLTVGFMSCHAIIVANCTSSVQEFFATRAGTATALMASLGFMTGAASGGVAGVFADGTPLPMVSIMFGACVIGITIKRLFRQPG
ncbi:multidrug effflux MFS transporter [Oceanobacter mangrovi]|uniref:multidrug effflux MFS transporter n=1 Tax=Oceanobacter mangrovi TaxID=2862510 RepID=UPI001C8DF51D|nr:multidrug effflux MFS transporter [Oceanobacter mangrovi]